MRHSSLQQIDGYKNGEIVIFAQYLVDFKQLSSGKISREYSEKPFARIFNYSMFGAMSRKP